MSAGKLIFAVVLLDRSNLNRFRSLLRNHIEQGHTSVNQLAACQHAAFSSCEFHFFC